MSHLAGLAAGHVVMSTLGGVLGPLTRASSYSGNRATPNVIPTVPDLMRLGFAGLINQDQYFHFMRLHGCECSQLYADALENPTWWDALTDLQQPYPSLDVYVRLWRAGLISKERLQSQSRRLGWKDLELDAHLDGSQLVPTPGELIALLNRKTISQLEFDRTLGYIGFAASSRKWISELANQIPGPADLVRFAVRHGFEPDLQAAFGFDAEISQDFINWHSKQGFGYDFQITDPISGNIATTNWAKQYWYAHWVWPSPGQGYQFLQRLRPTGGPNNGPRDPSGQTFSLEQLRLLLRGNDYPPIFRDKLLAISYNPLGRIDVRRMYNEGIFDRNELVERYQDMGYHRTNSILLADYTVRQRETQKLAALMRGQRQRVLRGYKTGSLDRGTAAVQLYTLSLTTAGEITAFQALAPALQTQQATTNPQVRAVLDGVDADIVGHLAEQAIAAIKRSYLSQESSEDEARLALQGLGIWSNRIDTYLTLWRWQFFGRGKSLAISQITRAVVRGVIASADAVGRIIALGYKPADSLALVQLALQDQALYQSRAEAATARSARQRQAALLVQQRLLRTQLGQLRHDLAYSGSEKAILRWLSKGIIDEKEVRNRLIALGHDTQYIDRVILDATTKLSYSKKQRATRVEETPRPPEKTTSGP